MKKILSFMLVILFIAGGLVTTQPVPVSALGSTMEVGEGKEYVTIQAAVDDAGPGDTILVYPGYYPESVSITKSNLTLLAQDEGVYVEPPAVAGFHVTADWITIRGFTIWFGYECAPAIVFEGSFNTFAENTIEQAGTTTCIGALAFTCDDYDGGSNFNTIENNKIAGDQGLKIASYAPDALNVGNVVRDNLIGGYDTGLYIDNGKGFIISGNEVAADNGTCIGIRADNTIPQGNHLIMNNTTTGCGYLGIGSGIELHALNSTNLTHNKISANQVSQSFFSDGIYLHTDDSGAAVSRSLVDDNTVYMNKNGIHLGTGVDNNLILENLVETNHATGMLIKSNRNKIVKNNVLSNATDGIGVEGDNNLIIKNTTLENDGWDLSDYGLHNRWLFNEYGTASWEAEVGWVVGEGPGDGYGAIINTTDGGENWVRQGAPGDIPDTALSGVSAIDGCNAWVTGGSSDGYGVILRTTDGGTSWVRQGGIGQIPDLGTSAVYAVNKKIAWVVGVDGLILHTKNGGRTWTRQAQGMAPGSNLEGVYASDPWNVWAVGDLASPCPDDICGIILHSTNGGRDWEQQTYTPSEGNLGGYLLTVHGFDSKNVWAVGNATVVHTTDGGETWQNVTPINGGGFYDWNGVFAVNENTTWVSRDNDGIFKYNGAEWHTYSPPPPAGTGGFHLVRVSAIDPQRVWIAGPSFLNPNEGIILHTDDGGVTWEEQDPGFEAGFWGVSFVKSGICTPNP